MFFIKAFQISIVLYAITAFRLFVYSPNINYLLTKRSCFYILHRFNHQKPVIFIIQKLLEFHRIFSRKFQTIYFIPDITIYFIRCMNHITTNDQCSKEFPYSLVPLLRTSVVPRYHPSLQCKYIFQSIISGGHNITIFLIIVFNSGIFPQQLLNNLFASIFRTIIHKNDFKFLICRCLNVCQSFLMYFSPLYIGTTILNIGIFPLNLIFLSMDIQPFPQLFSLIYLMSL